MNRKELYVQDAIYNIIQANPRPGRSHIISLLKNLYKKKKTVYGIYKELEELGTLFYFPNTCGIGFSFLLIEYKNMREKAETEEKYKIESLIDIWPTTNPIYIYSVYSVPTLFLRRAYDELLSSGVNAYIQQGSGECVYRGEKRRDLLRFAKTISLYPLSSLRRLASYLQISYSTAKFLYHELDKLKFFDGLFLSLNEVMGQFYQYLFLVKRGYEEPEEELEDMFLTHFLCFYYQNITVKLGMLSFMGADKYLSRAAEILGKYKINKFNLLYFPQLLSISG